MARIRACRKRRQGTQSILRPRAGPQRPARDKPPALIILDLMLPGMSGFQVLSRLKQDAALAPIPVVILSSLTQEDDIMKALTSGAADYITMKKSTGDVLTIGELAIYLKIPKRRPQ